MTDSSDDSADTVISVLDSRLSQLLSSPDSLSAEDSIPAIDTADCEKPQDCDVMGNRLGGEKKKKKDDIPPEKKPEEKPKKKGKKSKGKSKRNSQNIEGDVSSGQGACASPSSSTTKDKSKSKSRSKRPDVLADLGSNPQASPLGSPESASGSQGTWDDESDVSTLGYSTPLLSTPQVQRYVLPKQTTPQQSSTERLQELGRSIEKTIIDKLSDRPMEEGAAAEAVVTKTDRKERRNVKKKRALGQAVIDSDSFTLPLQDVKPVQSENRSPQAQRLNAGTEKISLRASQEPPVSPWLRDDDTPVDEEQMDEMFISCIDLSYNLADICSEKEFTEYGSLDSKKHGKSVKDRAKETSLSPRIARKPIESNVLPWAKDLPTLKPVDARETPPKSDSSTSTLAEIGRDAVQEASELDMCTRSTLEHTMHSQNITEHEKINVVTTETDDAKVDTSVTRKGSSHAGVEKQVKKKTGKSKSKTKSKKKTPNVPTAPIATNDSDIPTDPEPLNVSEVVTVDMVQSASDINQTMQLTDGVIKFNVDQIGTDFHEENQESMRDVIKTPESSENISEQLNSQLNRVNTEADDGILDSIVNTIAEKDNFEDSIKSPTLQEISTKEDEIPNNVISDQSIHNTEQSPVDAECLKEQEREKTEPQEKVPSGNEGLSPQEPASPKHVPPPSPSAMDALGEVDEDDEEALEALEGNIQLKEVQLFGETVFKRLSSLVESQSQDEDIEERFKDFNDSDDLGPVDTDSPPVNLGSMTLINGDASDSPEVKTPEGPEEGESINDSPKEVVEEEVEPKSVTVVDKSVVDIFSEKLEDDSHLSKKDITDNGSKDDKDADSVDDGTLKRKKKKSGHNKGKKDQEKRKKDPHGNVVKKPEIPEELKQVKNSEVPIITKSKSKDKKSENGAKDGSEKENTPPKRESQQIQEVIDAYGIGDIVDACVEKLPSDSVKQSDYVDVRPRYESDDDEEDDDSDSSYSDKPKSAGRPSTSSLEFSSCRIPDIEETFSELLSVKHILEDLEDRTPTEERLPIFVGSDELRSPPECINGRRSRMSPAITDRTESDLDISEQRDDISTDSMYADDEDDGASEVLFSRSYSEPAGNEVVVSCTFYNTQHNNNPTDSDEFWEDYSTADESFKQIEISADAASSTFQNARKQMQDIHQHLRALRRQMEYLQEEVESATLTPEYSMDSEDKRPITE